MWLNIAAAVELFYNMSNEKFTVDFNQGAFSLSIVCWYEKAKLLLAIIKYLSVEIKHMIMLLKI